MPNYQYRCQSCDQQFMKSLPFGSKEAIPCPVCNGATKRLIAPPTVHFKGTGFYKTDSMTKSDTPASASAASPGAPVPSTAPAATPPTSSGR